jgi:hypothetical protein
MQAIEVSRYGASPFRSVSWNQRVELTDEISNGEVAQQLNPRGLPPVRSAA